MLLQRSKLAAATVDRPRLAPPWSIAMLGTLVVTVLVAIYPHKALVNRVIEAPQTDITEAYLLNLLRTDPDNPRLGLLLARHQLAGGRYDKLQLTLAQLQQSPLATTRQDAAWLAWLANEQRYLKEDPAAPEHDALKAALRERLHQLAAFSWAEETLIEIARRAIAFGDIPLGLRLLDQLAARSEGRSAYWYAEAGRTARASGEFQAASRFFLIAMRRSDSAAEQRRHFIDAMQALQSGDRVREALTLADEALAELPALAESTQVLELLVRFARSVQRPDLADKYARKLLRLSLLLQWQRQQLAQQHGLAVRLASSDSGPQLPFDDRIYTLGFEAFLDNRKLEDAWQVAAAAVRQAPDSIAWRERLARVSEWTGRPALALTHWRQVARSTGSDEAWQAVLRLAPGLFDDEALLPALEYRLRQQPGNETLIGELVAAHERLGQPQAALAFLERLQRTQPRPERLAQMAELAERSGDDAQALALWRRFLGERRATTAQAVHIATLLLIRGDAAAALAALEGAGGTADADTAYWRLRGDLAAQLGDDNKAAAAYRHVLAAKDAEARDHEALARLLQDEHPLAAARVSGDAWLRFRDRQQLLQALNLYAGAGRWPEIGRLLPTPSAEESRQLRQQPAFLRIAAQYHLAVGERGQALADLDAALAMAPDTPEVQQALLWLLVESGEAWRLRSVIAARERDWQPEPAMHDALAAAYLALSLPDVALRRYLTPRLAAHRDDFLWLMNYADALEQNQEADRAWQLRRHLLLDERRRMQETGATERLPRELATLRQAARTRLRMLERPGDPAYAALRELLRLDRSERNDHALSPAARDAALAWLLDANEVDAARGWLWQQYAGSAGRPLWAEMRLAIESGDRAQAGQLLDDYAPQIPRHDRVEAAKLSGDLRLAQSEAFDAQTETPADDALHLQLSETLLAHSHQLRGSLWRKTIGSVDERDDSLRGHLAIAPDLSLELESGRIGRRNKDRNLIGMTPDETYSLARLEWLHADGKTRLTAAERDSFDRYTPLLVEHELRLDSRLSLSLALGVDQPASESTALRVAGMKDVAAATLNYQLTRRDRISVGHRYDRFAAQTGTDLGSGHSWQFEYAHAFRAEPRGLEAGVFWSQHRFSQRTGISDRRLAPLLPANALGASDVGADFFVPNDFDFRGIRLSTDMNFEEDYTRAWRPYASVARTWHSSEGLGYDLAAGLAGSVFGADHASIGWRLNRGGTTTGGLVREFGLTYRLHF